MMGASWTDPLGLGPCLSLGCRFSLWESWNEEDNTASSPQALRLQFGWGSTSDTTFWVQVAIRWGFLATLIALWLWLSARGRELVNAVASFIVRLLWKPSTREAAWTARQYAEVRASHRGILYSYRPLDPSKAEIRLARILPGSGDDDICIDLSHSSLRDKPRYAALSYTWGQHTPRRAIVVNGRELTVGANLANALGELRRDRGPYYGIPYWIDALCIHQADAVETSQQVRMMTRIFEQAATVTVWLGMPSDEIELAFAMMRALEARVMTSQLETQDPTKEITLVAEASKEEWRAIAKFFSDSYFTRVWVAQEISNPFKRNVEFVGGKSMQRFPLHSTVRSAASIASIFSRGARTAKPYIEEALRASEVLNRFMMLQITRHRLRPGYLHRLLLQSRWRHSSMRSIKLFWRDEVLWILNNFRALQATDSRDKVFAIFAILKPRIPDISIDYRLSLKEVYKKVVQDAISSTNDLDVLAYCDGRSHDLPSWVPDWRRIKCTQTFCVSYNEKKECVYASSMCEQPCVQIIGDEMNARGTIVDTIEQCSQQSGPFSNGCQLEWRSLASQTFAGEGTTMDMYRRTLLTDCKRDLSWNPFDKTWKSRRTGMIHSLMDIILEPGSNETFQTPVEALDARLNQAIRIDRIRYICNRGAQTMFVHNPSTAAPDSSELAEETKAVDQATIGRKLCTTKGCALGLVPQATQPGDSIAVLLGAHTPFVMRPIAKDGSPADSRYELVGECYLHGWMDGEALGKVDAGVLEMKSIVLV